MKICILFNDTCGDGYYDLIVGSKPIIQCEKCSFTCSKCENNNNCSLCIEGFYLQNIFINGTLNATKCL